MGALKGGLDRVRRELDKVRESLRRLHEDLGQAGLGRTPAGVEIPVPSRPPRR